MRKPIGGIMRIEDMPRPWLLAAVTGIPMLALLRRAEQEDAERPEETWQSALRDEEGRSSGADRDALRAYRNDLVSLES
jgi:hypothetical protein